MGIWAAVPVIVHAAAQLLALAALDRDCWKSVIDAFLSAVPCTRQSLLPSVVQLQAGGYELAIRVYAIIGDCTCRGYVPVMWRRGRLVVTFKKGSARKMENFRGILVPEHISKVTTMLLYRHVLPAYTEQIGQVQFGAAKHCCTAMASLMSRAFAESATVLGLSWAINFLALGKAFDLALRETVMGWMQCARLITLGDETAHIVRLGVPEKLAQDLAEWIEYTGPFVSVLVSCKQCQVDDQLAS